MSPGPARSGTIRASVASPGAMPLSKRANPEAVGDAFFADMEAHSLPGLRSLACSDVEVSLTQADIDNIRSALPVGSVDVAPSTAQMSRHIFFQDDQLETITLYLRREGVSSWCVYQSDQA